MTLLAEEDKEMNLSPAQKREIEVWEYFAPPHITWGEKTDAELQRFFEWSERGKHKGEIGKYGDHSHSAKLFWGKTWATRHARMFEKDIVNGATCYMDILGLWDFDFNPTPRSVDEYLAKEMFKGMDRELIMELYNRESK